MSTLYHAITNPTAKKGLPGVRPLLDLLSDRGGPTRPTPGSPCGPLGLEPVRRGVGGGRFWASCSTPSASSGSRSFPSSAVAMGWVVILAVNLRFRRADAGLLTADRRRGEYTLGITSGTSSRICATPTPSGTCSCSAAARCASSRSCCTSCPGPEGATGVEPVRCRRACAPPACVAPGLRAPPGLRAAGLNPSRPAVS